MSNLVQEALQADNYIGRKVLAIFFPIALTKCLFYLVIALQENDPVGIFTQAVSIVLFGSGFGLFLKQKLSPPTLITVLGAFHLLLFNYHWINEIVFKSDGYFQAETALFAVLLVTLILPKRRRMVFGLLYLISVSFYYYYYYQSNIGSGLETKILLKANFILLAVIGLFWFIHKMRSINEALLLKLTDQTNFLSTFFKIVLHDLRNPLSALKVYAMFNHDPETAPRVEANLKKMEDILEQVQMLYMNKIASHDLRLEMVDVGQSLREVLDFCELQLRQKNISVQNNVPVGKHRCWGTSTLCNIQVFHNLLTNAIKFSPMNGVIEISVEEHDESFTVVIKDQGPGMAPEVLQSLQSFAKSFSTPGTMGEKGTGFGLLIVKSTLELIKGQLVIDSAPQQGTSVMVKLKKMELVSHA